MNQRFSLGLLLLMATLSLAAQTGNKIDKSYKWTYDLEAKGVLELSNYDCDIIIHTWDKEETEIQLHVLADLKTDKDAKIMDQHISNLEFDHSPSRVSFKTKFWESRKQIITKKTIRLKKGLSMPYSELKIRAEVWLPKSADLELKSKYSKIDIEKINGKLMLDLYNDNLKGESAGGNMDIIAKYATIEFNNCEDIKANLYDSNFTSGETGDCDYTSKYSKVTSTKVLTLNIDSYNDKYLFETCENIDMVSKYTDLTTKEAGEVKIDSYEGSYTINNCKNLEIVNSKYTNFINESVKDLHVTSIYEGSISSNHINFLSIKESKYVVYKLGLLGKSIRLKNGYEDDFFIDKLSSDFEAIELNGKYLKCETVFNNDLDLKFIANIKYPHLEVENIGLTTKIKIKESSMLKYEAYKGNAREDMPLISLSGYEIKFKFK